MVEGLTKRFGRVVAVDRLSLRVEPGEVVGLVGPNGAGKTTTLRCIVGLLSRDEGRVVIDGFDLDRERVEALRRVGFVPDTPVFYRGLTALEHVALSATLHGVPEGEAVEAARRALGEVGAGDLADKRVDALSRGQLQRVAIAAAIVHRPRLLVLDEPFNSLDVEAQWRVKRLLRRLAEEGVGVLLTSHVLPWVEDVADRLVVIHRGRKIVEGGVDEVRRALGGSSLEEGLVRLLEGGG